MSRRVTGSGDGTEEIGTAGDDELLVLEGLEQAATTADEAAPLAPVLDEDPLEPPEEQAAASTAAADAITAARRALRVTGRSAG